MNVLWRLIVLVVVVFIKLRFMLYKGLRFLVLYGVVFIWLNFLMSVFIDLFKGVIIFLVIVCWFVCVGNCGLNKDEFDF